MDDNQDAAKPSRSLAEALAAFQQNDLTHTPVARLSDLSRDEARTVAAAWPSIPEPVRISLMRRFDELSEERIDVNFRRALRIALEDESAVVRQLAVAALWEDESRDMLDQLLKILEDDASPDVRAEAAAALERFSRKAVSGELDATAAEHLQTSLLAQATDAAPLSVHRHALESLGPFGADATVAALIVDAYESGEHGLQCSAIYAMGRSLESRWLPTVLAELQSDDPELRYEAARAAGALGSPDAFSELLNAARDDDPEVRHAAISAMGAIGGRGAVRALERLSEDAGDADLELIDEAIEDVHALIEPFASS